ncbi:MAG: MFS transporter [Myxococcales bacterium]
MSSITARFPSLESPDFRSLLFGQLVSLTGSHMQQVAVAWQLYEFTRSPAALGLLGAFRVAPIVAFALLGGVVADAFDRRRLMFFSQTALACVSLVLGIATHQGWASAWLLYAMAAVSGAALTIDTPTRQALVPLLVPRERLSGALSLWATTVQVATILGPSLGGLVLEHAGVAPVYFADAGSFLAVIGALLTMKTRTPPRPGATVGLAAAREGLAFLKRTPIIRSTMLLDFFATFFGGAMLLMPIYADQILGVGKQGLGLLYAAQPIGAAIAGAVMAAVALPRRQGLVILWSVAFYGVAIAVFGASHWFLLSLLALAASGAADTVSMVIRQTVRQLVTPDELRGRMTSVNMMFFMGGPQLGEVEAGYLARLTTPLFSVISGGLACVVVAAVAAVVSPALRRFEPESVKTETR